MVKVLLAWPASSSEVELVKRVIGGLAELDRVASREEDGRR